MKHELIVQNHNSDSLYEISELIGSITFSENLNDGASKLELGYNENDKIHLLNGCTVRHAVDEANLFYGKAFKWRQTNSLELSCTCYDQLKAAKSKDTVIIINMTLTDVVKLMCTRLGLKMGKLTNTKYLLPPSIHDNKSWLDIVSWGVRETLYGSGVKYRMADEAGYITLRPLEELKTNLVLGDGSLVYGYSYEKSADSLYNKVKVVSDNTTTGKRDVYIAQDSASIARYGVMQYFDKVDDNVPAAQAKERANSLLKLYNHESETLELDCLGDLRIRAGSSFYCVISDLDIDFRVICKKVTHNFLPVHTMQVEVYLE